MQSLTSAKVARWSLVLSVHLIEDGGNACSPVDRRIACRLAEGPPVARGRDDLDALSSMLGSWKPDDFLLHRRPRLRSCVVST